MVVINAIVDYIISIPPYMWSSLIILVVISLFAILVGNKIGKLEYNQKPGKFITLIVLGVGWFNNYCKGAIGKHWRVVAPAALTLGIYIYLCNISTLFLLKVPTENTVITAGFALFAFGVIQTTGIISRKGKYLGVYFNSPNFLMSPVHIIGDFTPLLSMSLRLFGSIASGGALVSLVYGLTSWASIAIAPVLHLIFDVGFGAIQAVVFTVLTITFAGNKCKEEDFEENE